MNKNAETIQYTDTIHCQANNIRINRREIVKLATISAGVALFPFLLSSPGHSTAVVEHVFRGKPVQMKGTLNGKILASNDNGITWEMVLNLGADCPVRTIRQVKTGLQADIVHKGSSFTLHSENGRRWMA